MTLLHLDPDVLDSFYRNWFSTIICKVEAICLLVCYLLTKKNQLSVLYGVHALYEFSFYQSNSSFEKIYQNYCWY